MNPSRPAGPLVRVYQTHSVFTPQIGLNVGTDAKGSATPPPVESLYHRPDGTSLYHRPDGTSLYLRP